MVRDAGVYRWSSHRAYLGEEVLAWLSTHWVLGQFGARAALARSRFAAFVAEGRSEGHSEVFYGSKDDPRVVGEEDFLKHVLPRKARPAKRPSLAHIVAYVCAGSGVTEAALRAPGRGRTAAQARTLIAWLAVQSHACTLAAVAARFHRSASTLSHLIARLEKLSRSSSALSETLQEHLHTVMQA